MIATDFPRDFQAQTLITIRPSDHEIHTFYRSDRPFGGLFAA